MQLHPVPRPPALLRVPRAAQLVSERAQLQLDVSLGSVVLFNFLPLRLWGCHCDPKIGSCIVERFQHLGENLEWAYCVPNEEFYCAGEPPLPDAGP